MKSLQIAALRNLKAYPNEGAVRAIAKEVAECASAITNGTRYEFVSAVPGGTSGKQENFSSLVARFVAAEMGLSYRKALAMASCGSGKSSHPKQSMHFRSRCADAAVQGKFGLLVDDVATTGAHFSDCVAQLRKVGTSVVCVSWIG